MPMLVTGCAGFIGSHLCETLLQRGETVIGIDSITSYYSSTLKRRNLTLIQGHPKFIFLEADLVEMDLIPCLEQVDTVFHTAGQPGVRGSWGEQFDVYVRNNISATQRLLEAIRQTGRAIKIIYSSSSSIYGNSEQFPTPENALPRPYSPYGMTKLAGEHLCHLYYSNYQIPYVALRYFTVYGPRQRPDMAFHIFIRSVLREEAITILGDGNQTRDFTYVADIVQGNLLAAENLYPAKCSTRAAEAGLRCVRCCLCCRNSWERIFRWNIYHSKGDVGIPAPISEGCRRCWATNPAGRCRRAGAAVPVAAGGV